MGAISPSYLNSRVFCHLAKRNDNSVFLWLCRLPFRFRSVIFKDRNTEQDGCGLFIQSVCIVLHYILLDHSIWFLFWTHLRKLSIQSRLTNRFSLHSTFSKTSVGVNILVPPMITWNETKLNIREIKHKIRNNYKADGLGGHFWANYQVLPSQK